MQQTLILKHKNNNVALLELSDDNSITKIKSLIPAEMPYLRDMTLKEINSWWNNRAIPDKRKELNTFLQESNCDNSLQFMTKNLAISLSDCYWVCPISINLSWEQVNLYENTKRVTFSDNVGNEFSNNPNGSLNGSMDKEALFENNHWILKKHRETLFGEQCVNELFANLINSRQPNTPDYVKYNLQLGEDRCNSCTCDFFTDNNLEFITAYNFTASEKQNNSMSNYEQYINLCIKYGLNEQYIRNFMDYQTLLDFIITNTDRHYQNFGVLRNPDTLKIENLAPIFDCGNSMFYDNGYKMSAYDILNINITAMAKYEEKMLEYVSNKDILIVDNLPSKDEVLDFYIKNKVNEAKAENIAYNYQIKVDMLNQFQKGFKVSRYTVKDWDNFLSQEDTLKD